MSNAWIGKSVLVVDDSTTYQALLAGMLQTLGAQVRKLSTAAQFREWFRSESADLIILDYRLPGENGLELLQDLRGRCLSTPVVLITGEATLRTATQALTCGADGFLDKRHLKEGPLALGMALEQALAHRQGVLAQIELQARRESFDTLLAHDLRSPVACASTALKVFEEARDENALEVAQRSLQRFFDRLDRYLTFSEMDSNQWKMQLRNCELWGLLSEVCENLRPLARAREQTLLWTRPEGDACVQGDPLWLAQGLENLIGNAIKYTQLGGCIEIEAEHSPEGVLIEIQDNGPGIPLELQFLIFQPFFRLPADRLKTGGSGLGLSIARNVAEAHRGLVSFRPNPGGGSVFRLSLPSDPTGS